MSEIQLFKNPAFGEVRVVMDSDTPWFVAKDVAKALGYERPVKAVTDHVDEEDRKYLKFKDNPKTGFANKFNNLQRALWENPNDFNDKCLINESGVYGLILASKLPTAKKFKHWITSEVLPSIRKHGAYATPATIESILGDPDSFIKLCEALKAERKAKEQAQAKIEEDRPKVLFADAVTCSKSSILIGELAKLIKQNGVDIGQNRLFQWLRNNGYLMRDNIPTQYSMELELFQIMERTVNNPDGTVRTTLTPKVTGKGQTYFVRKLLEEQERKNDTRCI